MRVFFCFQRFTEPQLIDQSVYILIGIGGLMFFLGFLGYCGAIRESQCLLSLVSHSHIRRRNVVFTSTTSIVSVIFLLF